MKEFIENIPVVLILGITECAEHIVNKIPNFYTGVVCSYAYINRLDVNPAKQNNLWATEHFSRINKSMVSARFIEIYDLPVINNVLDLEQYK